VTRLAWIPLVATLLGCGHYGPPLRADEVDSATGAATAPAEQCDDPDHKRDDGSHVPHETPQQP